MVNIYTTPSCKSCIKALHFLNENKIPYNEKNIFISILNETELKKILKYTEEGFDSIISKRSNAYKDLKVNFDSLELKEAMKIIIANPSILKRPIIIDTEKQNIEIGYNSDGIRIMSLSNKLASQVDHDENYDVSTDVERAIKLTCETEV